MSERKVIQKYFPPDFDPAKIPRRRLGKEIQHKVRLMTPFSMRCSTCGEYIYKGKKFNARKEAAKGEEYLGIQIFRFYIRCPRCAAEITFKTDPKNADYTAEHGIQRNFEPWRDEAVADEELKNERVLQEENNPMKALENRTVDSKREIDILDALDEIRAKNAMNERADPDALLNAIAAEGLSAEELLRRKWEEEDEAETQAAFRNAVDGERVRRIEDDDDEEEEEESGPSSSILGQKRKREAEEHALRTKPKHKERLGSVLGKSIIVKKRNGSAIPLQSSTSSNPIASTSQTPAKPDPAKQSNGASTTNGLSLISGYGSDSD